MLPASIKREAHSLLQHPKVSARIRELRNAIAERTIVSARQQLVELAEMAAVDISELWRLEQRPCADCVKLYEADRAGDTSQPHPNCHASAKAHQHVQMIPLDQWPPAARRLYDGLQLQRDGTMRPVFRDRTEMADMVNKMLGAYVSRSENITAHVTVTLEAQSVERR